MTRGKTTSHGIVGNRPGKVAHVLSAFAAVLEQTPGHVSSRGKGRKIRDALRLLERLDLADKVVTGDAIFAQKSIGFMISGKAATMLSP